jgi:hypothetical protein
LFVRARSYAERLDVPWFVLSAEYGLVQPDEWIGPYDRYLPDTPLAYRQAWGAWALARLELLLGDLRGRMVEVHASEAYVAPLRAALEARTARVVEPLAGLPWGNGSPGMAQGGSPRP